MMSFPLKPILFFLCLIPVMGQGGPVDNHVDEPVTVTFRGPAAQAIFDNLSDSLLRPVEVDTGIKRQKVGYAISCSESGQSEEDLTYQCQQSFFDGVFTSNPYFIWDIPVYSGSESETFIEVRLTGFTAQAVFAKALRTFPNEVETCSDRQTCQYYRLIRAQDITCYERITVGNETSYDCWQYIQSLEGYGVPGGGDPMIGVVLAVGEDARLE